MSSSKRKTDELTFEVMIDAQDASFSTWAPRAKFERDHISSLNRIELAGAIVSPDASKYRRATITIMPGPATDKLQKRVEFVGYAEATKETVKATVPWPDQGFSAILSLVANRRLVQAHLTITRPRYREAMVVSCILNTFEERYYD